MPKQLTAALVCVSTLALLVGVIQYEPPVGSNVEKAQHRQGQKCPPGKTWNNNQGKRMCE
jgi:hypothetical protein